VAKRDLGLAGDQKQKLDTEIEKLVAEAEKAGSSGSN
jgi:hypothetical protein